MTARGLKRAHERFRDSLDEHRLSVPLGKAGRIDLLVHRLPRPEKPAKKAVLLLHGGNSSGDTFLLPDGGFAAYLRNHDWDVWLLEWRGSPRVLRPFFAEQPVPVTGTAAGECSLFTVDEVAKHDIPEAIRFVRGQIGDAHLAVLGHCLSGGALAMSIARNHLEKLGVSHVVLSTLGLFYEVPWDGWVKVEDFILERVLNNPTVRSVDPTDPAAWPGEMKRGYDHWPSAWKPTGTTSTDEILRRLSFMVGQPWSPERLVPGLHSAVLDGVFGPLHLGLYLHTGQMVRRGFAAEYGRLDVIDRARLPHGSRSMTRVLKADEPPPPPPLTADYMRPEPFRDFTITVVAAMDNRLWHRDAADLMYEWLRNEAHERCFKEVFPGYNLQELFWGLHAQKDVYPKLEAALAR